MSSSNGTAPPHSSCDDLGHGRNAAEERAIVRACHHERAMEGFHTSFSMLGNFLAIADEGLGEEMDAESTDPSFASDPHHGEHLDSLHTSDRALRGAEFGLSVIDSFPSMIDRFRNGGM